MKTLKYFTILLISIPVFLYGDIIIVDQNGTGDYYTIQEGINNSNIGDTVLVYPGNYFEIVDFIGKDKGLAILNDIKGNQIKLSGDIQITPELLQKEGHIVGVSTADYQKILNFDEDDLYLNDEAPIFFGTGIEEESVIIKTPKKQAAMTISTLGAQSA